MIEKKKVIHILIVVIFICFFFGESRKKLTHILFVRIDIYFLDALASMLESQSVTD